MQKRTGLLLGLAVLVNAPILKGEETRLTPTKEATSTPETSTKSTFYNQRLLSPLFQAPAQVYQSGNEIWAGFASSNLNDKTDNDNETTKVNANQNAFTAAGTLMATDSVWLNLGIENTNTNRKYKSITNTESTTKVNEKTTTLSPTAAFAVDSNFVVAATLANVSYERNYDEGQDFSANYGKFMPSAVYHDSAMEIGMNYTPSINIREKTGEAVEAGTTSLFGQFKLTDRVNLGGALTQIREADIDSENHKNVVAYKIGAEGATNPQMSVGGSIEYKPESAKNAQVRSTETMPTIDYSVFAALHKSANRQIGANLSYMTGLKSTTESATTNVSTKNTRSGMNLSLAGTMLF